MFSSAKTRRFNPEPIILPEESLPVGKSLSPHVISLWEKTNTPCAEQKKSPLNTLNPLSSEKTEILINQRLHSKKDGNNDTRSDDKKVGTQKISEKNLENRSNEPFHVVHMPESEPLVPSSKTQIAKVKQAMNQFEELRTSFAHAEERGFFRNLKRFL